MLGRAFTDEAMVALCFSLLQNKNIVAVNLGEATDRGLTANGWEYFRKALPHTGLVYFYANNLAPQMMETLKSILRNNRKGNAKIYDRNEFSHMWRL